MFKKALLAYILFTSVYSLAEEKTIKIAITNYPPYEFKEEGKVIGLNADMVLEVFKRIGYKIEFTNYSWKRALDTTIKGETDAIMSISKSKERERYFIYSHPLVSTNNVFFKLKDTQINVSNLEELKNYVIGTVSGYIYGKNFDKINFSRLEPMQLQDPEFQNLKKLAARRLDLVACDINVCHYLINNYKEFSQIQCINSPQINKPNNLYIAFNKNNLKKLKDLVDLFNIELEKFLAEGGREKLLKKYKLIQTK